jgi:Putative GTPase activating protein for Arf
MKGVTLEENKKHVEALKLLLQRPENRSCADCRDGGAASRSSWASINTGVFICMRCAGIHRGLGVHISKVGLLDVQEGKNEEGFKTGMSQGQALSQYLRFASFLYPEPGLGDMCPAPSDGRVCVGMGLEKGAASRKVSGAVCCTINLRAKNVSVGLFFGIFGANNDEEAFGRSAESMVWMQVRSVTLDTWLPEQVAFMTVTGNGVANAFWEAKLQPGTKPHHDSPELSSFIRRKVHTLSLTYRMKPFFAGVTTFRWGKVLLLFGGELPDYVFASIYMSTWKRS